MGQASKHGGAASLWMPLKFVGLYAPVSVSGFLCPVIPQCSVYKCPVHTSPKVFSFHWFLFIIFIFVARCLIGYTLPLLAF